MIKKIAFTFINVFKDMREKRGPTQIKLFKGNYYAYCNVRQAWVKIKFKGE